MTAILLFLTIVIVIMVGYPVAFTLAGISLLFALAGIAIGAIDFGLLRALPTRIHGILTNGTLIAVPLFIFMGVVLQKTHIADELLLVGADLLKKVRGGLAISVVIIGAILAASTGVVGATVTTMGLLSLPTMLKRNYDPALTCGTICASGTLGQIIPPSIVLVLLGEVMSSAYQQAQLRQGLFAPDTVSVADLFAGAIIPGLILVGLYIALLFGIAYFKPSLAPVHRQSTPVSLKKIAVALVAPLILIAGVLGSILSGAATPTEAAAVGAVGAVLLAYFKKLASRSVIGDVCRTTVKVSCMVFMILIGASFFSLVFRGFGGDDLIHDMLASLPGGLFAAMLIVMLMMFLLGFVLDFIEITFIVVPIVGPSLIILGADPLWLAIMIAINLQTSFLTPPFGFSLFYLRGVTPPGVATRQIYKGVIPFVGLQVITLLILSIWPGLVTWLPSLLLQ